MRRRLAVIALLTWGATSAHAEGVPREYVRLERVDVQPTYAGLALVRAFVSLTQIEGGLIKGVDAKDYDLVLGEGEQKSVPHVAVWSDFGEPMDLVVVLEIGKQFAEVIDELNSEDRMVTFLSKLPKGSRAAVITYGSEVKVLAPLGDPKIAARKWTENLVVDDDYAASPVLIKAINRAVNLLDGAKPVVPTNSVRKVMVLISDGIDDQDDPFNDFDTKKRFTDKAVKPAVKAGVTIHSVGFSPYDNRSPLLNLGELSKKTAGTFRWAETSIFLPQMLELLAEQLSRQVVLTYLVPQAKVPEGTKVRIYCQSPRCGENLPLKSKERVAAAPRCGGQVCGGPATCVENACHPLILAAKVGLGVGTWLGIGGGGLAGLGLVVGLVVRSRNQKRAKAEAKAKKAAKAQNTGAMPGIVGNVLGASPGQIAPPVVPQAPAAPQLGQAGFGGVASGLPAYGMRGAPAAPRPEDLLPQAPQVRGTYVSVLSGPHTGKTLPLRHGFNIGKNAQNDLVIDDGYTSGYHAQLISDASGAWTLVDMTSTNGTFVNGVRIQQQRLQNGMSIRIGQTELRFLQG